MTGHETSWEEHADRLAGKALAEGEPTAWFERLYAAGSSGQLPLPWDSDAPRASLVEWAQQHYLGR